MVSDVVQVGCVALIQAVERYDPNRDVAFSSYAVPTIEGEIKRYFRDKVATIRPPRRAYELRGAITKVVEDLRARLQRSPKISEIAEVVGESKESVLESLEMSQRCVPYSLDMPLASTKDAGDNSSAVLGDIVSVDDHQFEELTNEIDVQEARKHLTKRESNLSSNFGFTKVGHRSRVRNDSTCPKCKFPGSNGRPCEN